MMMLGLAIKITSWNYFLSNYLAEIFFEK